ncbi:phytanoyl-CoA dioxygenase family protein [Spirosoma radiotolerans]|uniref:phytanoyl-CoA dioxygenase family protein n=1 Tax=Spirosoma radiotolerans TaxID=1379870 RepID=UPI00062712A2|nr:phytanoyl-CoA dioxygenase family protein [Spirosoma radiotolerans]
MIPQLFTPIFNEADPKEIADELRTKKGYRIFEKAIALGTLADIVNKIEIKDYLINNNNVGVVRSSWSNFLSHTLAVSQQCYDIITSEQVRAICRNYFDGPFKLSSQRLYETHTQAHLPWHTDNNLLAENKYKAKHSMPGLVFLFYLSDVSDINPFQLIPESYTWADTSTDRYFSDKYINDNYADQIVSVRAPKGTLILSNSHLVHRAEPFKCAGFRRYTFIFQVDEMSENYAGHGERLLINPAFVNDTSPEVLRYLGFGTRSDYVTLPQTSVSTLLPHDLLLMQKNILPQAFRGLMLSVAKSLIPAVMLNRIRNRVF